MRLEERAGGKGYAVHIEGDNLHAAIMPPLVTVGGETVGELKFSGDGRSISGNVHKMPQNRHTIVDYGFTRTQLK